MRNIAFLFIGILLLAACSSPQQENKATKDSTTEQSTTEQPENSDTETKKVITLVEKECTLVCIKGTANEEVMLVFAEVSTSEKFEFQISAMELETLQKGMMEIKHGQVVASPSAMQAHYVIAFEEKEKTNKKTGETKTVKRLRRIAQK
jgi:uncharacterized protein YcfL